jgi:type II secretory pathway pseudopilin PulG
MLTAIRDRLRGEHGVTLLEMLIAMVVTLILGGLVVNAMSQSTRAAARNHNRITALAEVQTAAQRIARELRAADPITVAQASVAEATIVRGGQTRTYRYQLAASGTEFQIEELRTVGGVTTTSVLADGFASGGMVLRYYNGAGVELLPPVTGGNLPLIQTIRLTLTRFIPLSSQPITLETTVDVRNQA